MTKDLDNILRDLKAILFDDDYISDMFYNSLRDSINKIRYHTYLRSSIEDITVAFIKTHHNQFFDLFCLMDAMEKVEEQSDIDLSPLDGCSLSYKGD